jgi:endonuclease/exonuclease/phosphatase family metal-dependent hydrolase
VFDGPNNFNGRWNHDEVRFFADYVDNADYIYDDSGTEGGLEEDASYVLMGDMNAGPETDRTLDPATKYFLENEDFNTRSLPTSPGGARLGNPEATATFGEGSQVDWVLPSPDLSLRSSSVVWPNPNSAKRGLSDDVAAASDHRLVWADVRKR